MEKSFNVFPKLVTFRSFGCERMADSSAKKSLLEDVRACWATMPARGSFLLLLGAWFVLFHLAGNSTFGWVKDDSLFSWMYYVFTSSPDDDLCLYIPMVILGIFAWRSNELAKVHKEIWWSGLFLIAAALLLHMAGYAVQQARVSILGWGLGIYGISGLLWGKEWLKATFFPMFLLAFMVPIASVSDGLTLPLRLLATKVSVFVANVVLGIPVQENGSQILGPDGGLLYEVAPACSGIRSLTSMTVLMVIYSFMVFSAWWRRLVLIGCAIPIAILSNVTRLTIVIVVGEAFSQERALAVETNLGFLTFGLGFIAMLVVSHLIREAEPAVRDTLKEST